MLTTPDLRRSRFVAGEKHLLSGKDFRRLH